MKHAIPTWTLLDKLDFRLGFMRGKVSNHAPDLESRWMLLQWRRDAINPRARRLVDRLAGAREVRAILAELAELDLEIESRIPPWEPAARRAERAK